MSIVLETAPSAVEAMVQTADAQIADLEDTLTDLAEQIHAEQAALRSIADTRAYRARQLAQARAEVERCQQVYETATSYATLAQDTPQQQPAIEAASDAKKHLHAARKALSALEHEDAVAAREEAPRERELTERLEQLRADEGVQQSARDNVLRGRKQALTELGKERYARILTDYQERQVQLAELRTSLIEAQIDLLQFHEQSLASLTEWQDLQAGIAQLAPVETPTLRVMQAALLYAETLARDLPGVSDQRLRRTIQGASIWDLIIIPNTEVFAGIHNPSAFAPRMARLQRAIEEYRADLAS